MTIATLAASPLLNALSGIELIVYLRLLLAMHHEGDRRVKVANADLYRETRTAGRALLELERLKLIRVERKDGESRTIAVLG